MIGRQLIGMAIMAALTGTVQARTEQWTASGSGQDIVVTDCADCDEDIGIMLSCRGEGQPAMLYVPFLAQENDPGRSPGTSQLVFSVDGVSFPYEPSFELWGQIGYVPVIPVGQDETLLDAMQSGTYVDVAYDGGSVEFPLTGSRAAFAAFSRNCAWSGAGIEPPETGSSGGDGMPQSAMLPIRTRSWGGKVRNDPSMDGRQIGSLREMDPITVIEEVPHSMMNGYPWFRIRFAGGEGYQWGGIICQPPGVTISGAFGVCTR